MDIGPPQPYRKNRMRGFLGAFPILLLTCASALRPNPMRASDGFELRIIPGVPAHRGSFVDVDGDGYLDVCVWDEESMDLFLQRDGKLVRFTEESGINVGRIGSFALFADVNGDGRVDLFSARRCDPEHPDVDDGRRSEILLNRGGGRFTTLPQSGVGKYSESTSAASFLDYDGDGKLDLFVGNWYRHYGVSFEAYPSRLYRGDGTGHFEEATERAGLMTLPEVGRDDSSRPTFGVAHCDWNNDGRQDILLCSYGRQGNRLYRNNGDGTFTDVAARTTFDGDADRSGIYPTGRDGKRRETEPPWRANGNTFDAACADFDNDGDIDVFLAEIRHWWAGPSSDPSWLLVNQGPEHDYAFVREPGNRGIVRKHETEEWNEGDLMAGWIDFDNDGLLDLLIASSDYPDPQKLRLFRQLSDHTFRDVTEEVGLDWEGASSISVGDFNRDGAQDILVGRSFFRLPAERTKGRIPEAGIYLNRIGTRNHWVNVKLRGVKSNRDGIGARVIVKSALGRQMREIYGGLGHNGHQNPFEAHFGLCQDPVVDELTIEWPSGHRDTFREVAVNRLVEIVEGGDLWER